MHTMLQSAQASAAEERENGGSWHKLACVGEKNWPGEQSEALSKTVADVSAAR